MNHPHPRPSSLAMSALESRIEDRKARTEALGTHRERQGSAREPKLALVSAASGGGPCPGATDTREPLEPGTLIGGRYALEALVGTGAFGNVYRAHDTMVEGHMVALKLHHARSESPSDRAHAMRELRLIASVFHPSVVQYKDHGWYESRLWFVMPCYVGETLEDRMARGPLGRLEAYRIFEPLARALAALHSVGIRHQDLKPDNIFLARLPGRDGAILPVLLDLGVAATESERVMGGTPPYFPPEIASFFAERPEEAPAMSPKADVFSLALALRNALEPSTADEPGDEDLDTYIARRARRVPEPPSGAALSDLAPSFRRWLSPDPAARPTAEGLAAELDVLRRSRRPVVVARTVALLALGALMVFFGRKLDRPTMPHIPVTNVAHALALDPVLVAPITESRAQATESRAPTTENRAPTTENQEPTTEDRAPQSERRRRHRRHRHHAPITAAAAAPAEVAPAAVAAPPAPLSRKEGRLQGLKPR